MQGLGRRCGLVFGEPPAGLGAEGGRGGSSHGAGVSQGAEGEVQLPEESEVLALTLGWGVAHEVGGSNAGFAEPLPQGASFTTAGPRVSIQTQELDALDVFHGLAWYLGQGVVEQVKDGQAAQVTESTTVDLPDAVVVEEEAVQVDQASERILRKSTDAVSM